MTFNDVLQKIREEVTQLSFITECKSVEYCTLTGVNRHIELTMVSPDTQEARKKIDVYMTNKYPTMRFRYIFIKQAAN